MIQSRSNPKVQLAREVRDGGQRGLALIEGERGVVEAAEAKLRFVVLLAEAERVIDLATELADRGPRPLAASPEVLSDLSDLDAPRGAIAVVERPRIAAADLDPDAFKSDALRLLIYADRVQDPTNLGALARVCAAAGADALLTSPGCAHPNHHRALRASAWSLLSLPVHTECSFEALARLAPAPAVALDARAPVSVYDYPIRRPAVVVIGGEMGINPERLATLDSAAIPMPGKVDSLNLAVAAGIALFEWSRRLG